MSREFLWLRGKWPARRVAHFSTIKPEGWPWPVSQLQTSGCSISRVFLREVGLFDSLRFIHTAARTFIFNTDQSLMTTGPVTPKLQSTTQESRWGSREMSVTDEHGKPSFSQATRELGH